MKRINHEDSDESNESTPGRRKSKAINYKEMLRVSDGSDDNRRKPKYQMKNPYLEDQASYDLQSCI